MINGGKEKGANIAVKAKTDKPDREKKTAGREEDKAKFFKTFKGGKKNLLIVLGLCAGVMFIVLSFLVPDDSSKSGESNSGGDVDYKIEFTRTDTNVYIRELEVKLCEALKRVRGISEPYVMITLESSSEYIYATKEHVKENSSINGGNSSSQKELQSDIILYSDVQKAESPILVKEIQPKIKGVAVVCKGIDNAEMQLKIINLVATVLNLPTNRVCVAGAD